MVNLFGIHRCKHIRNGNLLRTPLHTIPARGTGDQIHTPENLLYFCDGCELCFIQMTEILHVA